MESIENIALELDRMIEENAATAELASLLGRVCSMGNPQMKILATLCRNSMSLLEIERAREWPGEHAAALGAFIRNMPCVPLSETYPCGGKELFIAAALQDTAVPKSVRIHLWRSLVMDGYKFSCYVKGREWTDVPHSLYDHPAVRKWLYLTKQEGGEDLRCSDKQFFDKVSRYLNGRADREALEAIKEDSPSALLMPLDFEGRRVPKRYVLAALAKKAVNIITYLVSKRKKEIVRLFSPKQLLFYACANWNDDDTIPFVELLERDNPGLVKNSLDAFGHDALWYTLYQRDRFNRATPAARRKMTPLARMLIELGCDPNRQNSIGLSYNDLTV